MNSVLAAVEKALSEAALDQLPTILGELERLKILAWQRVIASQAQGKPTDEREGLLTIPQTAIRLNIPQTRAYELTRQRGGFPVVRIGKYLRVNPVALEGWLSQQDNGLDKNVSVAYTQRHGRKRTQTNPEETRVHARAISRAAGRPLEFDRPTGTRGNRHSRITSAAPSAVAGSE
jgi:hypothetical protein